MKSIISISAVLCALCLFSASPAKAVTLSPGDLIKASGPAVYYYSENASRLVFPTEKTFFSWFNDFTGVKTITDTELATIPLGGNVTYRPGVKLVKITTDPRVYAVSSDGTLRHLATETVASELYGPDWNTKIDDIPDAFFINYKIGSPITSATDFNPAQITALATSIDTDKDTTTPPVCTTNCTPTPTSTPPIGTSTVIHITLTVSKTTVKPGDVITLSAQTDAADQTKNIRLYYDGSLVMTCNNTNSCTGQVSLPLTTDKDSYEARAIATNLNNDSYTAIVQTAVDTTPDTNNVTIRANQYTLRNGQSTGIIVNAPDIAVSRIDIYVDNSAQISCQSGIRTCSLSHIFSGSIGATHTAFGLITDNIGRTYRSRDIVITIAANDSPAISLQAGKPLIYTNETVDITISASDGDGIKFLEILDANKTLIKHCDGAAPCTTIVGPWTNSGTHTFFGRASDLLDGIGEEQISIVVENN